MPIKISELPEAVSPDNQDIIPIVDINGVVTKKIKRENLFKGAKADFDDVDVEGDLTVDGDVSIDGDLSADGSVDFSGASEVKLPFVGGSDYIRLPDGTQICWVNDILVDLNISSKYSRYTTWTLPKPFINTNYIVMAALNSISPVSDNSMRDSTIITEVSSTQAARIGVIGNNTLGSGETVQMNGLAIGRWRL